jgi:hypothetical protein
MTLALAWRRGRRPQQIVGTKSRRGVIKVKRLNDDERRRHGIRDHQDWRVLVREDFLIVTV